MNILALFTKSGYNLKNKDEKNRIYVEYLPCPGDNAITNFLDIAHNATLWEQTQTMKHTVNFMVYCGHGVIGENW